ncbi:unnamed protein product [Lampetra planeri]
MCRGIGYNHTYMPNDFNHDSQDEAGLEVHQFWPLVEIKCSPDLRFFLCSMYTPICLEDYKQPLPPCRSVCERARAGCAPLMRQYGFAWPDRMRCDRLPEHRHVHYETTGPALCTVVFLLTYFFGMASSIWWVILSLTWFMAAGMKWSSEAIAGYSQYYHLAAWLLPSVQSVAVLATSSVDADPLGGICSVGAQSLENLRGFVLVPLTVYLCVGAVFLLAGFTSLVRIRNAIKQQGGTKTDKLEKLMVRIGIFSMLYTVPAIAVVACYFYEERSREGWARALICPSCQGDEESSSQQQPRPDYGIFMLKYFMCLVVGITSGVWIWSGKTVDTWKRLCCRCCGRGGKSSGAAVYSEVHGGSGGGGGGGGGGHHHHHHHHHHLGTASGGPGTTGAARAASSVASSVSCHKPAPLSLV